MQSAPFEKSRSPVVLSSSTVLILLCISTATKIQFHLVRLQSHRNDFGSSRSLLLCFLLMKLSDFASLNSIFDLSLNFWPKLFFSIKIAIFYLSPFFIDDAHEHHFIDFSVEILERTFTLGHRIDIIHFSDLDAFFKLIMSKNVHELIVLCTIAWPSMFEQAMCAREKNWKWNYNTHTARQSTCEWRSGRDFSKFINHSMGMSYACAMCDLAVNDAHIGSGVYSICDMRVLWWVCGCMCETSLHSFGFIYLMSPYCRWNPTDNVFSSCGLQIRIFYVQNILCGVILPDYAMCVYVRRHTAGVHCTHHDFIARAFPSLSFQNSNSL